MKQHFHSRPNRQVDLRPGSFNASEWESSSQSFLASRAELIGGPDHETPFNAGVWLAKPSFAAFHQGLEILHSATWSEASGEFCRSSPERT